MSQPTTTVQFTESFLASVHSVDRYFQDHNPAQGQRFVRELFDLLYDVVAAFPRTQLLFQPLCQSLPGREFRRALFRQQYLAIYEVKPDQLLFVLFRHSSLDSEAGAEPIVTELR